MTRNICGIDDVVLSGLNSFLFLPRPPLRFDLGCNIMAFQAYPQKYQLFKKMGHGKVKLPRLSQFRVLAQPTVLILEIISV